MASQSSTILRHLLPWAISGITLVYVFGYAVDWEAIPDASAKANLPVFIAITVFDKLAFFVVWGLLQAEAVRRFVEPVSRHEVLAIKGGSELLRVVNNSLADAGFFYGVSQLVSGRIAAVIAVAGVPFGCHFFVLLLQATLALPLLEGPPEHNRDVWVGVGLGWALACIIMLAVRRGVFRRALQTLGLGAWISTVDVSRLAPFVGWFMLFAVFDVAIQGLASRAFGNAIEWSSLMARIPLLYVAISIPSLGNFGTRELAWSNLFEGSAPSEELVAFALWTNAIFLIMHVVIGTLFVSRAVELARGVRSARAEGSLPPSPILHDSIDR